jgi:hypothetical protein
MALALRVPVAALAARTVGTDGTVPLAVPAAGRPERIAVRLALSVAALSEPALPLPVLAPALSVPEGLAVTMTVARCRSAVHREFGNRPRRRIALDAGQRGPDQAAVQADLGVGRRRLLLGELPGGRLFAGRRVRRRGRGGGRNGLSGGGRLLLGGWSRHHLARGRERRGSSHRLLPAARGRLPAFVLVLGVARRAPDLPDVLADERHDGVVAQPPLARTVVIDEITNPKLARKHAQSLENAWWDNVGAGRTTRDSVSSPVLAARSERRTQVSNP